MWLAMAVDQHTNMLPSMHGDAVTKPLRKSGKLNGNHGLLRGVELTPPPHFDVGGANDTQPGPTVCADVALGKMAANPPPHHPQLNVGQLLNGMALPS